jgi:hypothetical protein
VSPIVVPLENESPILLIGVQRHRAGLGRDSPIHSHSPLRRPRRVARQDTARREGALGAGRRPSTDQRIRGQAARRLPGRHVHPALQRSAVGNLTTPSWRSGRRRRRSEGTRGTGLSTCGRLAIGPSEAPCPCAKARHSSAGGLPIRRRLPACPTSPKIVYLRLCFLQWAL